MTDKSLVERADALIDGLAERIAGVVEFNGSGFWRSCSGCFEAGEYGGLEHLYPYSKVLDCKLGGGCSECGGIGAVFDSADYEEMARAALNEGTGRHA